MHLGHYIKLLHHSQQALTNALRAVGAAHPDEPDVRIDSDKFAGRLERHTAKLEPALQRYSDGADAEPEHLLSNLFHGPRSGPLGVLRDLHDLYLLTSECDIVWTLIAQAAQGAPRRTACRDRRRMPARRDGAARLAAQQDEAGGATGARRGLVSTSPSAPRAERTDQLVEQATRIVLRPIANPLPLGFLALGGGTLLLSGLQLEWVPAIEGRQVAVVLLAFVVPLQFVASLFGFLARDAVAGTGMGILAGTWLSISLVMWSAPPGSTSKALGLLLLAAAAALVAPAIAATLGKLLATAVLATTALRLATTAIYQLTGSSAWREVSGVLGLVLFAIADYAAFALLLEDVRRETLLPTFRRGRGRSSITGNLRDQLLSIEHEAGVREQL